MQADTKRRTLLVAILAAVAGACRAAPPRLGRDFVFLSNERQPLLLDAGDRRQVVLSPAARA